MKNRFGADGMTFPCKFDPSNGHVSIYEEASADGMLLKKKMKDGEKSIKKLTKTLYDSMQGSDSD